MSRYTTSKRARSDLQQIWNYVARDRPGAADRFVAGFRDLFETLADFPGIGTRVGWLRPGMLRTSRGNYNVYDVTTPDGIEVVRVLHGARKLKREMFR